MHKPSDLSHHESAVPCFHCGLDANPLFTADIAGQERHFCCVGCQAVTRAIVDGGLGDFYSYRDARSRKPEEGLERFDAYDVPEVYANFVSDDSQGQKRVKLLIGGITCAACAWLIEHELEKLLGITQVRVNVATHMCQFVWDDDQCKLSAIFSALTHIGYRPQPGITAESQVLRRSEQRSALLRIGIAGLGMMQVGMVGIALHAGAIQGMEHAWQHYLRWISLLFALPVMFYSAQPFFRSALRVLKLGHLNMDVPVSLALILAFSASVVGTVMNRGEVYFDSVSMFTFFLLVGRYLEMRARHRSVEQTETLSRLLPSAVERVTGDSYELIPLEHVKVGDVLRVAAGEVIPCDGTLIDASVFVDESLLTGESEQLAKEPGDSVYAGALLAEPSMKIQVTAHGAQTRLSSVQDLLDEALANKPRQQQLADRIASYFVAAVLALFITTFGVWWFIDSTKAFWVALSVLVVTCPCALSLATPAALASGLNALRRSGLLVMSSHALEVLPRIRHVVFDKTGTLTLGKLGIQAVVPIDAIDEKTVLQFIAALERHSRHPIAKAFDDVVSPYQATGVSVAMGKAVSGDINGKRYGFGRADFLLETPKVEYPAPGAWQLLSCEGVALAWVQLRDAVRPDLNEALKALSRRGLKISVLSGDRKVNVDRFKHEHLSAFELNTCEGDLLPEEKLAHLRKFQSQGEPVMMIGDGINDVPVLGAADISVAMGASSRLAQVSADAVLLNQNLLQLSHALDIAQKVNRVIKQNLSWALGYNLLALPAAVMGFIPPYLAALGMSLSSLVVVFNSLRVRHF